MYLELPHSNAKSAIPLIRPVASRLSANKITITASSCAGKTTVLLNLQNEFERTDCHFISTGKIMRRYSKENGMEIEVFIDELDRRRDASYDYRCDNEIRLAAQSGKIVVEGRLAHSNVPDGFHVLFVCGIFTRGRRFLVRCPEFSLKQAIRIVAQRDLKDRKRYQWICPENLWHRSRFDCIIDTAYFDPHQVTRLVIENHRAWLKRHNLVSCFYD